MQITIILSRVGIAGEGGWGVQTPPPSSCLQTLIFEWKWALNFNLWAKFQTFRLLTPSSFRSKSTNENWYNVTVNRTRKPCCRKETTRCCKCSFRSKFANNIPYKYKTSHASKATLQSSKHAGAKHNLTQKSGFKVNQSHVFGVSGKAVRQ